MSTNSTTGPGGVKNLRAMFETRNPESTSPPSRGRSPNGSVSSVHSRPVSKVRSSFVAVERPGEAGQPPVWGLRKASDVSEMASVKEQVIDSVGGAGLGEILKGSAFEGPDAPEQAPATTSTAKPESKTKAASAPSPAAQKAAPSIDTAANAKSTEDSQKTATPTSAVQQAKMNGLTTQGVAERIRRLQSNDGNTPVSPKPETTAVTEEEKTQPAKTETKTTKPPPASLNTEAAKPATKSQESPELPKKSPTLVKKSQPATVPATTNTAAPSIKPRGGVNKIKGVIDSSNRAKEERAASAQKDIKPPSVATKPTAAPKAKEAEADSTDVQPKIKSPTLPTKLPSAATTLTAAAAAKKELKTEKDVPKTKPAERKPTVPQAPRVATTTTRASLAKKSSRASLASAPEKEKSKAPRASNVSRAGGDDSFLARMMRPTASSAQKAHDKVQVSSPPRPTRSTVQPSKKLPRRSINPAQSESAPPVEDEVSTDELPSKSAATKTESKSEVTNGHTDSIADRPTTPEQAARSIEAEPKLPPQQAEVLEATTSNA